MMLVGDLSRKEFNKLEIPEFLRRNYLGGLGYLVKLLYDNISPGVSPYSPENILGIASGPLSGRVPYSGKVVLASKSPLTNGWGESHAGGSFSIYMNRLGLEAILLRGKREVLSYLVIGNEGAKLFECSYLTNSGTFDTIRRLRSMYGRDAAVLAIGPAGENKVRFASIASDGIGFAGRTGLGAVMGSKNLKAIVLLSDGKRKVSKSREASRFLATIKKSKLKAYGTSHLIDMKNDLECLPTKNHQLYTFRLANGTIKEIQQRYRIINRGCPLCLLGCKKYVVINGRQYKFPEYESIDSLGPNCEVDDIFDIITLSSLCDSLGLDTISMGKVLSFMAECSESGLISEKLDWGDANRMRELILETAFRRGYGNFLAEGSERMSKQIPGSEAYLLTIKGMEMPAQDPRNHPSMGLAHAIAARGADHLTAFSVFDEGEDRFHVLEEKLYGYRPSIPEVVRDSENLDSLIDSLILCKSIAEDITVIKPDDINRMLHEVTNEDYDILSVAESICNMRRRFLIREGQTEERLPKRILEPLGKYDGYNQATFQRFLKEYYNLRGWDESGNPPSLDEEEVRIWN